MTNAVFNGNAYSDDGSSSRDMLGGGHRQWLLPMLSDAVTDVSGRASHAEASEGEAALSSQAAALSAQGASQSAATASGAATTATAAVAQAQGVVAGAENRLRAALVPRTNLVPDVQFLVQGKVGWSASKFGDYGMCAVADANVLSIPTGSLSYEFAAYSGSYYTITGDSMLQAATGSCYFDVLFLDASHNVILDGPQNPVAAPHYFDESGENRKVHAVHALAPAGTVRAVARFSWTGVGNASFMAFRQMKVEKGSLPATPYSLEENASALFKRIPAGTSAALNVPATVGSAASATEVVRGDDPRLTAALSRGVTVYTSSQTISRNMFGTATYLLLEMWGAGSSGAAAITSNVTGSQHRCGGEGGEYASYLLQVADLPSAIAVVVGAGGTAVTATGNGSSNTLLTNNQGADSTFAGIYVAKGGTVTTNTAGYYGASKNLAGKNGGEGGGGASSAYVDTRSKTGGGQDSVFGGAGGGGSDSNCRMAGNSVYGGSGGAGLLVTATGSTAPSGSPRGGGGGGIVLNSASWVGTATSGAGGRGEVKLTWF